MIVRDCLTSIPDLEVGHYEYHGKSEAYAVWAEDTEGDYVEADNFKTHQAIQGSIDYFTKDEYDPAIDAIQLALNNDRISFYLNSIQYEDETELIHYEWVFTL